jgi:DNA-binding SARP family transcriptional activator
MTNRLAPIRLRLLGAAQWMRDDVAPVALERRGAALLALLALEGPVARERAAGLVWCDTDRQRARNSLRQRIHLLYKSAGQPLVESGMLLQLAGGVEHDLSDPLQRIESDPAAGKEPLLGDLAYDDCAELGTWVAEQRQRWRGLRLRALADVASRLEQAHRIDRALDYAQHMVDEEPLNEHAHRRLMRLHYLRGDRAAALAACDRLMQVLARELGLRPSAETTDLARLIERSGTLPQPGPQPPPLALLRPPVLVGRAQPWQLLEAACAAGGVALISGEPGIGKSRLLGTFAEAQPGALMVSARPDDQRLPYALLARLLRTLVTRHGAPTPHWVMEQIGRVAPELAPSMLEHGSPHRLQQALAQAWREWAARGATALVIDDLQFADAASVEALLAASLEAAPRPAWLFGVRTAEMPEALTAFLADPRADALWRADLQPLQREDTEALLSSLQIDGLDAAAWAEALVRHTGGNPLFVLETLRAMLALDARPPAQPPATLPAPHNIGRLIERRLQQLTPQALRLARVAAVAGTAFDAALAAHVLDAHPLDIADAWRELETAQVLRGHAFAHDLIHEAARRSVPEPIARVLHASVASYLESHHGEAITVAGHWHAAQEWARAGPWFQHAAELARAASRRKEEADALALAAECFDKAAQPQQLFEALAQRFDATNYVEQFKVSRAIADELLAHAVTPQQRVRALDSKAQVLGTLYEYHTALAAAREASALAAQHGITERRLALAQTEGRMLAALERHDEALATLERCATSLPDGAPTAESTAFLVEYGRRLDTAHRPVEALAVLERAGEMAHARKDWTMLHDALLASANALYVSGRVALAAAAVERARKVLGLLGAEQMPQTMTECFLARLYRMLGRFRESHAQAEATVAALRDAGNPFVYTVAVNELVQTYLWMGQVARARQTMALHVDPIPYTARSNQRAALAYLAAAEGKPAAAAYRAVLADFGDDGRLDYYILRFTMCLCEHIDADEAAVLARESIAKAESLQLQIHVWTLKVALIEALTRGGRARDAVSLALDVMERFADEAPAGRYPPDYWRHTHACLAAAGHHSAARQALRRGVQWIREVGLANLPPMWHDGFKHRQLGNVALLAAAAREGLAV